MPDYKVENQECQFVSQVLMQEDVFKEMSDAWISIVNARFVSAFFLLLLGRSFIGFWSYPDSIAEMFKISTLILAVVILFFGVFLGVKRIKVKQMVYVNRTNILNVYLGEKIWIEKDGDALSEYEYEYDDIRSVIETKNYFFIRLKYNAFVTLQKDGNAQYLPHIFHKATNIKKKKVVRIRKKKKTSAVCFGLIVLLFFYHCLLYFT